MKEIHVAGKPLPLNPSVFDGRHGTVLDSGTTYAYLPEAAFVAFKDAVRSVSLSLTNTYLPKAAFVAFKDFVRFVCLSLSIHSSRLFFKKVFLLGF